MVRKRNPPARSALLGKRIALICFSRSLGGLELTTLRLAKAIRDRATDSLVIVPPSSPLEQRARQSGLTIEAAEPLFKYGDLLTTVRLGRILRERRIDIAILMQSKDIHLAALASMVAKDTKLVFYQQMDSGYNKRDLVHTWLYSKLSHWVTLTGGMKKNVVAFTRVPAQKISVVPLGIDIDGFNPARYSKSNARAFFKLPDKALLVGVVGRLDPQKGQEIVLRAIPSVGRKLPRAHFVLAGDETAGERGYKAHLQTVCRQLGIEKRVTFLPFTEDVPRLLAALDVFVLPSFSETYGLVIIEAMAMQRPVIATNAGGVPEIVAGDKTGLLVEPRDVASTSNALIRLLKNPSLRLSLGRAARKDALKRYDAGVCVDELLRTIASP